MIACGMDFTWSYLSTKLFKGIRINIWCCAWYEWNHLSCPEEISWSSWLSFKLVLSRGSKTYYSLLYIQSDLPLILWLHYKLQINMHKKKQCIRIHLFPNPAWLVWQAFHVHSQQEQLQLPVVVRRTNLPEFYRVLHQHFKQVKT